MAAQAVPNVTPLAGVTILLILADDVLRVSVAQALRHRGKGVIEARSGSEALLLLDRYGVAIDLVVADASGIAANQPALRDLLSARLPRLHLLSIALFAHHRSADRALVAPDIVRLVTQAIQASPALPAALLQAQCNL